MADGRPVLAGAIGNIGYARWLASGISVDGGILHTHYFRTSIAGLRRASHDEVYVGVFVRGIAAHLYYSPDYLSRHGPTLYGEVSGSVASIAGIQLTGQVGLLTHLAPPASLPLSNEMNWSVGVTKPLKRMTLIVTLGGREPLEKLQPEVPRDRLALTGGLNWTF